jgi:hypothetical protein
LEPSQDQETGHSKQQATEKGAYVEIVAPVLSRQEGGDAETDVNRGAGVGAATVDAGTKENEAVEGASKRRRRTTRSFGGSLAVSPRKLPAKSVFDFVDEPVAAQPDALHERQVHAEETTLAFGEGTTWQGGASGQAPEETEPDLPPTLAEKGIPDPIMATPPKGLHNTPRKRGRKRKVPAEKPTSSPLKPKDDPPAIGAAVATPATGLEQREEETPPHLLKRKRIATENDALAPKRRIRDELLMQLKKLQAEIGRAEKEQAKQRKSQGQSTMDAPDDQLMYDFRVSGVSALVI